MEGQHKDQLVRLLENESGFAPEQLDLDPEELLQFVNAQRGLDLIRRAVEQDNERNERSDQRYLPPFSETSIDNRSDGTVVESECSEPEAHIPKIGRFEIVRELGRGGFGIVLLARDPRLDRQVALKIPRVQSLENDELSARFEREARSAALLGHPNIVPIFESGSVGPVKYIAFEFCPGKTLQEWLRDGDRKLAPIESAKLLASLADAVQHAHSRGVVHRDLKPGNILVEDNSSDESGMPFPRITDFGLAKLFGPGESMTQTGAALGTPAYMSPEQARGELSKVGPASDLYSLGAMLYELLTGKPPFRGETHLQTLRAIQQDKIAIPSSQNSQVPADLEAICLKCLEKEPRLRYASASELAHDLESFVEGRPVRARQPTRVERLVRWHQANRALSWAVITSFAILMITTSVSTLLWMRSETNRKKADAHAFQANRSLAQSTRHATRLKSAIDQLIVAAANEQAIQAKGLTQYRAKLFETANGLYAEMRQDVPDDPELILEHTETLMSLAELFFNLGYAKDSLPLLDDSIEITEQHLPDRSDLKARGLRLRAKAQFNLGRLKDASETRKQALQFAREIHQSDPTNEANLLDLIYMLAMQLSFEQRSGDFQLAQQFEQEATDLASLCYGEEIDQWPPKTQLAELLLEKMHLKIKERKYPDAVKFGDHVIRIYDDMAATHAPEMAVQLYNPEQAEIQFAIGIAHSYQNQNELAKEKFQEAWKLMNHGQLNDGAHAKFRIEILHSLSLEDYHLKNYDEAAERLREMLANVKQGRQEYPGFERSLSQLEIKGHNLLHGVLLQQDKADEAAIELTRAIELCEQTLQQTGNSDTKLIAEMGSLYNGLCTVYGLDENWRAAIDAAENSIQTLLPLHRDFLVHKVLGDAHYNKALCHEKLAEYDPMLEALDRFVELVPDHKNRRDVDRKRITALVRCGRLEEAMKLTATLRSESQSNDDLFALAKELASIYGDSTNTSEAEQTRLADACIQCIHQLEEDSYFKESNSGFGLLDDPVFDELRDHEGFPLRNGAQ